VQISTDAQEKIIVGVGLSQSSSDAGELEPAVERVEANLGRPVSEMLSGIRLLVSLSRTPRRNYLLTFSSEQNGSADSPPTFRRSSAEPDNWASSAGSDYLS
jgi:hypothetical protein